MVLDTILMLPMHLLATQQLPPNCYGSKEKKLQQYAAFAPTTSQLKIQIDVVNPNKGTILEAAIIQNCAVGYIPLSCDTSSSSVTVGQNVNFVPGQTYILNDSWY
jgi:hypothetical protein